MPSLGDLQRIAEVEFKDIVSHSFRIGTKLRIFLIDGSFIDAFLSQKLSGRFGFHWERKDPEGHIYRFDNFPNTHWKDISSFPYHFHDGSQGEVKVASFPQEPLSGFRAFMDFVRSRLKESR